MKFKSCKPAFNIIDDEKKFAILEIALNEFSKKGFNSANINVISAKAGISIGLMYKYVKSKRALYMTCVEWTMHHLSAKIEEAMNADDDAFQMIEHFIRAIQKYKQEYKTFTQLYYEMATEGNSEYARLIATKMEGITSDLYAAYIESAKKDKQIRQDIDPRYFAFFIDNLLMMLQFSYSCEYYEDRMQIFTYKDALEDDEKLVEQAMMFIKGALLYKE